MKKSDWQGIQMVCVYAEGQCMERRLQWLNIIIVRLALNLCKAGGFFPPTAVSILKGTQLTLHKVNQITPTARPVVNDLTDKRLPAFYVLFLWCL